MHEVVVANARGCAVWNLSIVAKFARITKIIVKTKKLKTFSCIRTKEKAKGKSTRQDQAVQFTLCVTMNLGIYCAGLCTSRPSLLIGVNPGRSLKSRQSESALAQVPITPNFEGTQPFTSLSMSLPCLILNSTKVVKQESRSRRKMKKDRKTLIIPHSQGQSRW